MLKKASCVVSVLSCISRVIVLSFFHLKWLVPLSSPSVVDTEGYEELENKKRFLVDVRDLADALLLVYERPEAEGRYLCMAHAVKSEDLVAMLKKQYPNYNYPKRWISLLFTLCFFNVNIVSYFLCMV